MIIYLIGESNSISSRKWHKRSVKSFKFNLVHTYIDIYYIYPNFPLDLTRNMNFLVSLNNSAFDQLYIIIFSLPMGGLPAGPPSQIFTAILNRYL